MDLIQVHVFGAEPSQARIDLAHDGPAGQAGAVRSRAHPAMHLGGDHHLVARREILQRPPDDLFARAIGIDIGGIEEIDPALERLLDERAALLLVQGPAVIAALGDAVAHAAETNTRDIQPGPAKLHIIHPSSPLSSRVAEGRLAPFRRRVTALRRHGCGRDAATLVTTM
jgi:hypothetical protein